MTKLLQEAIEHLKALPETEQDAIAVDMIERVTDYSDVRLSEEQQAEVRRRLANPSEPVSEEAMQAFFARFGIEA